MKIGYARVSNYFFDDASRSFTRVSIVDESSDQDHSEILTGSEIANEVARFATGLISDNGY